MALEPEHQALFDALNDRDAVVAYAHRAEIPAHHKEAICILYNRHCRDDDDDSSHGGAPNSSLDARPQTLSKGSPQGTPRKSSTRNPFSRFMKMDSISIPPHICRYIDSNGTDPRPFFYRPEVRHYIEEFSAEQTGDAFLASYYHTVHLNENMDTDRTAWIYMMLQYYDIGQEVRPGSSGNHMGARLLTEIQEFLESLVGSGQNQQQLNLSKVAKDVYEWCLLGAKINILVSEFGAGCILPLAKFISPDFLKTKITKSGPNHELFVNHMRHTLGIDAILKASRTDELGDNIRGFLIRPFKEAAAQQAAARQATS